MSLVYAGEAFVPEIPQDPSEPGWWKPFAFLYIGKGWVRGIPARNLTVEEAERIGRERLRGIVDAHTRKKMYLELPRLSDTDLKDGTD